MRSLLRYIVIALAAVVVIAYLREIRTVLLFRAAALGQTHMLGLLLATGIKVDTRDLVYGETPLMNAAAEGQDETLLLLIQRGAQLDARSKEGGTALDRAVGRGQTSAVRILIEHGASLENGGPLLMAIWEQHLDTANLLIERGSNVNAQDSKGDTPLIHAARKGLPREFVLNLMNAGADTRYRNRQGKTPAMIAVESGHTLLMDVLSPKD